MASMSARDWILLLLLVVAVIAAVVFWRDAQTTTLDELLQNPATYTMTIMNDEANSTEVKVVSSVTGDNSLPAVLGDYVIWKNDSTQAVKVQFNQLNPLFGVDEITLEPGDQEKLKIADDAYFANPGYVHDVKITQANSVPGSKIIVCPPAPLPCN